MTCSPCHLATPPGITQQLHLLALIGRWNCSSAEAHRRPITGEEVELGEEEPSECRGGERPEKEDS
ncbi:unnamed protein product [Staurois parvus]|uniref:Uncharacterized protein n=1 Tax=Staurois parvus TaxID=386267 RepID=A0ABN9C6S8_9NEOB|nr:unnamed protein product [Staurois parvus]